MLPHVNVNVAAAGMADGTVLKTRQRQVDGSAGHPAGGVVLQERHIGLRQGPGSSSTGRRCEPALRRFRDRRAACACG